MTKTFSVSMIIQTVVFSSFLTAGLKHIKGRQDHTMLLAGLTQHRTW